MRVEINNCLCGNKPRMRSFKNTHYGYKMICEHCKKESYNLAIPLQSPAHLDIRALDQLQRASIAKWNMENPIQKVEIKKED